MKKFTILLLTLAFCVNAWGEDSRWWQREELKPSENQIINPDYLSKLRNLEIVWDQKTTAKKAIEYFSSKGQNISAIRGSMRDIDKQLENLERELKSISPYISPKALRKTTERKDATELKGNNENDLVTFGNKVMFKLDLSQWSTAKLINFTNDFEGTGGIRFFGIRILPSSYVLRQLATIEGTRKFAVEMSLEPSKIAIMFEDVYAPDEWSTNRLNQDTEILKMEDMLSKGKAVFVSLFYNGDDVSLRLPEGIYFLQYVMCTKLPTRFSKRSIFSNSRGFERCSFGPYYIRVTGNKHDVVTYTPKPFEIGHDRPREYYSRLQDLGADSLILESLSNDISEHKKEKPVQSSAKHNETIYIRCLSCGKLNPEEANYCQECGKKLVATDFDNPEEANYCQKCGKKLVPTDFDNKDIK